MTKNYKINFKEFKSSSILIQKIIFFKSKHPLLNIKLLIAYDCYFFVSSLFLTQGPMINYKVGKSKSKLKKTVLISPLKVFI